MEKVPAGSSLAAEAPAKLKAVRANLTVDMAQTIKNHEKITNHDIKAVEYFRSHFFCSSAALPLGCLGLCIRPLVAPRNVRRRRRFCCTDSRPQGLAPAMNSPSAERCIGSRVLPQDGPHC